VSLEAKFIWLLWYKSDRINTKEEKKKKKINTHLKHLFCFVLFYHFACRRIFPILKNEFCFFGLFVKHEKTQNTHNTQHFLCLFDSRVFLSAGNWVRLRSTYGDFRDKLWLFRDCEWLKTTAGDCLTFPGKLPKRWGALRIAIRNNKLLGNIMCR
jgi:hypothetical protein